MAGGRAPNKMRSVHAVEQYSALKRKGMLAPAAAGRTRRRDAEGHGPDTQGRVPHPPASARARRESHVDREQDGGRRGGGRACALTFTGLQSGKRDRPGFLSHRHVDVRNATERRIRTWRERSTPCYTPFAATQKKRSPGRPRGASGGVTQNVWTSPPCLLFLLVPITRPRLPAAGRTPDTAVGTSPGFSRGRTAAL